MSSIDHRKKEVIANLITESFQCSQVRFTEKPTELELVFKEEAFRYHFIIAKSLIDAERTAEDFGTTLQQLNVIARLRQNPDTMIYLGADRQLNITPQHIENCSE